MLTVRDDGRGIDPARVAMSAAGRGLIPVDEVARVDASRAIELAFEPGVTTAELTTDVSGRGVGLDAVASLAHELGGSVTASSEPGAGTVVELRLPATGTLLRGLLVEVGRSPVVIPLDRVERAVALDQHTVRGAGSSRMLVMRDGVVPLVDLAEEVGLGTGRGAHAVVVGTVSGRIALLVDRVVGERSLVKRPMTGDAVPGSAVFDGAVLAAGGVAPIVSCDALSVRLHSSSDRRSTAA